jgi:benzoyl-CoA reductase/2-hydroxyglutaryl-CoA dehydratase subunit BcrC/BadD/HgdB
VRDISALRKRNNPPIDGHGFLEITCAAATPEAEELIPLLEDVFGRLARVPDEGPRRLRLLMSGGIIADGDRHVLDLAEDEIGAVIVAEDHCTGFSPFYQDTDASGDPWRALADAYLDRAPCARQVRLEKRVQYSQATDSNQRGAGQPDHLHRRDAARARLF